MALAAVGVVPVTAREDMAALRDAALDARRALEALEYGAPRGDGPRGPGVGDPVAARAEANLAARARLDAAEAEIARWRARFARAGAFGPAGGGVLAGGLRCAWLHWAGLEPWAEVARSTGRPSADAARAAAGAALDLVDMMGWPA